MSYASDDDNIPHIQPFSLGNEQELAEEHSGTPKALVFSSDILEDHSLPSEMAEAGEDLIADKIGKSYEISKFNVDHEVEFHKNSDDLSSFKSDQQCPKLRKLPKSKPIIKSRN